MLQEIHVDFKDFSKIVIRGQSYQDRKELLWRCYAVNPKREEVMTMTLDDIVDYIRETDEFWDEDKKYVDACIALIKELA